MYQKLIDALIRVREVMSSTMANPYTLTQEDLTVLRIQEMIISQPLQKDGRRGHLSELSDKDFLTKLPTNLRDGLKDLIDGYSYEHWGMRDAILSAATNYRRAKKEDGLQRDNWFRSAVIDHLRALGYQEHVASKIAAATSERLVIDAVRWARDAFRRELTAHPKSSFRDTDTWKDIRKGIKTTLICMLRGLVEEGREDHLSHKIIRNALKARGHQLPRVDMKNRETVLGFLEAARLSLLNMPWHLVG
ncbi:MAG: hypothetical protein A2939_00610 [Parcubacteria group bacterium RIFCSPLOWO2_01_FULL_48_18]|nr:MAG: hypothetical protein A2939_00610 [Parcubacteria group bacterium RIFCSPLOWO2_01_FULL_48_18]HLD24895.1 hypothetical protein [Patescibacteria group bacterium]